MRILLIDNGGDSIKFGWLSQKKPHSIPNVSARLMHQLTTLVGDELNRVQNPNSLMATRSTERGIICNLENQLRVWKRMLDLMHVHVPCQTNTTECIGWKIDKKSRNVSSVHDGIPPHKVRVVLLLAPHCPRLMLDQIANVWIEDFGVSNVAIGMSSVYSSYHHSRTNPWRTSCTVNIGFSSSLVVPTHRDQLIKKNDKSAKNTAVSTTIRRLPIGGRLMINMLKHKLSYRQYNLMDASRLTTEIFERLSFVSLNFDKDLNLHRYHGREVVLPDYKNRMKSEIRVPLLQQIYSGRNRNSEDKVVHVEDENDENFNSVRTNSSSEEDEDFRCDVEHNGGDSRKRKRKKGKLYSDPNEEERLDDGDKRKKKLSRNRETELVDQQVLKLSVERFAIPEVLFNPVDAGLQNDLVGLPQAIVQSVEACPEFFRPALYQSIFITGGGSKLPNLMERLTRELRSLVSSDYTLKIVCSESPIIDGWMGAKEYFRKQQNLVSLWENQ